MTQKQFQHALQPLDADDRNFTDVDKFLCQYEEFVKVQKSDKVCRTGTSAFFLLVNFFLLIAYGLLAIQQGSDKLIRLEYYSLAFVGVALCFLWWRLVKLFYLLCRGKWNLVNHLRTDLLFQAIRMRWYWFLERIPLHDDAPTEKVAAALPLAFGAIHILFAGFGIAQLM